MSPERAEAALAASMARLVEGTGQLSGLTVCYGTPTDCAQRYTGLRQEVRLNNGQLESAPLPLNDRTIHDLASLTKLYTLVSVLQLLEAGALRLEDSIHKLDPRFDSLRGCTLADCLSYRQSLQTPQRVDAQADAAAARAMVFRTYACPVAGERLYSDMNALVLKYVVEAVSGLSFAGYLAQAVFRHAGLKETWARVPPERLPDCMNYNHEHQVVMGRHQLLSDMPPGQPHDPKARLLRTGDDPLSGHAGLFATAKDVCRFAQALLAGRLVRPATLLKVGVNRTGYLLQDGSYRQFLGWLCFAKSPVQRFSEVPEWMGLRAFGLSGYTGNHLAMDPETGVFDLMLGNRCHNRLSLVSPEGEAAALGLDELGVGSVPWPDGRRVRSSFRYIRRKDQLVHNPVRDCLIARGWLASPWL